MSKVHISKVDNIFKGPSSNSLSTFCTISIKCLDEYNLTALQDHTEQRPPDFNLHKGTWLLGRKHILTSDNDSVNINNIWIISYKQYTFMIFMSFLSWFTSTQMTKSNSISSNCLPILLGLWQNFLFWLPNRLRFLEKRLPSRCIQRCNDAWDVP